MVTCLVSAPRSPSVIDPSYAMSKTSQQSSSDKKTSSFVAETAPKKSPTRRRGANATPSTRRVATVSPGPPDFDVVVDDVSEATHAHARVD